MSDIVVEIVDGVGSMIIIETSDPAPSLGAPAGPPGDDGREVELRPAEKHIQWRYTGEDVWRDLVSLAALTGKKGDTGDTVELRSTATHIQWRNIGGSEWRNIVPLSVLVGPAGRGIAQARVNDQGRLIVLYTDEIEVDIGYVVGPKGASGRGVSTASVTGEGRLVLTYTDGGSVDAGHVVGPRGPGVTTWGQLENKPDEFKPTTHKHAMSDLSDLATWRADNVVSPLASKADLVSGRVPLSQLPSLGENTSQDIRSLWLRIAEMEGDRLSMIDGIADPLEDTTDINLTSSANFVFDEVGSFFEVLGGNVTSLVQSGGNVIASQALNSNFPERAFDGTTNTAFITNVGALSFLGMDFSASRKIVTAVAYTTSASNISTSVRLEWSDDLTNWVEAATVTGNSRANTEYTIAVPAALQRARRAWRIVPTQSGLSTWSVAEMSFRIARPPQMSIVSRPFASHVASPGTARLMFQVIGSDPPSTLHGFVSRDGGANLKEVPLTLVGVLSDGTKLLDGEVSLADQATGNSMVWCFVGSEGTLWQIHGVVMQWRK